MLADGLLTQLPNTAQDSDDEDEPPVTIKGTIGVLQPIMPLDLPVKVRPWELTVAHPAFRGVIPKCMSGGV